uniref:IL-10G n=1 Tax=Human cytomegalovirus TaxID=10359 RepID=A0FDG8_HCMV|nr:IL-10G [Human betaherpesvirus 5]
MLSVMVSSSLVLIVFLLGASEEAKPATTTIKNTKPQCRPEDYATRLQDLRVTFHRVKPTLVGHVGDHVYPGLKTELHSMRSTLESIYKDMRQCEAERKSDNGTRKGLSELDTLFSRLEEYLHSRK